MTSPSCSHFGYRGNNSAYRLPDKQRVDDGRDRHAWCNSVAIASRETVDKLTILLFLIDFTRSPMATTNSPPPPTLPTSSAPGERAKKLRDVHARALKNALKPVSQYENFAACFPTPAKYCEDALRQLHSDFVRKLGTTCETEFEALLHEREVVASLNQLDALVEDAKKRKAKTESEGNGESEASMP